MSPSVRRKSEPLKEGGIQQEPLPSVCKGPYRGDVSALCLVSGPERHLLLAGTGAQVLVYDLITGELLHSRNVFDGVRVHGIQSGPAFGKQEDSQTSQVAFNACTVVIHGERKVKLFKMLWHLEEKTPQLQFLGFLPRFSYWVMDVRILEEKGTISKGVGVANVKGLHLLAVGLSNNTIDIWDLLNSAIIYRVECSERCLLYSMRLWGDSLATLHAGAGTVFNEVLVWKLGPDLSALRSLLKALTEWGNSRTSTDRGVEGDLAQHMTIDRSPEFVVSEEVVHPLQTLRGHEGSIHRLTWSSDGSTLVSVSDDRSARVWCTKKTAAGDDPWSEGVVPGPVLYGHGSRLWDCCVDGKLLVTASEDCTCRVWTAEGKQLASLKGHIGRGVWRCVYDPEVNSLVTAGADSSIKVQSLDKWFPIARKCDIDQDMDSSLGMRLESQSFSISPPWLDGAGGGLSGFMDSKSEYVRCLGLGNPWSLYVCTNQGAVYHVNLRRGKEAPWTLLRDELEGPIVCMDALVQAWGVQDGSDIPNADMVVVGTGKGSASVMQVRRTAEHWRCEWRYTWVAEKERQLLGVYFCKSLGGRYVFTTDPRGSCHMWRLSDRSVPDDERNRNHSSASGNEDDVSEAYGADLVASARGSHARVLCLDVCPDLELLVLGDKRGDLSAFSLPKGLCQGTGNNQTMAKGAEAGGHAELELRVVATFKGAHGISAIASVLVLPSKQCQQAEIISTGSDGCICRFILEKDLAPGMPQSSKRLLCTGIEKVAALSIVESLEHCKGAMSLKTVERRIAAGFTGSDFMLWDLTHQCEIMRVICGGWRRPHSVLVGSLPEQQYCFVFIKGQVIQVEQNWVTAPATCGGDSACERGSVSDTSPNTSMQSLRGQFHGKEISSVLFLHAASDDSSAQKASNPVSWIATGSEDGTVLLSRYTEDAGEQLDPTAVLGDHVGGSSVRALAVVAKVNLVSSGEPKISSADATEATAPPSSHSSGPVSDTELLFSAGAKEVLTCWLLDWLPEVKADDPALALCEGAAELSSSLPRHRAPSSQWLSTHTPEKAHSSVGRTTTAESSTSRPDDGVDDDQRYLALTAFGTRCLKTGALISFVVTASSNATLHLHAFHVAHRSWIELAVLENDGALVLAVDHFVAPFSSPGSGGRDVYIVITGATNGNIALWDVTDLVHENCNFDGLNIYTALVAPLRPLTGRGSQGGRRRKKAGEPGGASVSSELAGGEAVERGKAVSPLGPEVATGTAGGSLDGHNANKVPELNERAETKPSSRLSPLEALTAAHQSGINCLTVARIQRAEKCASSEMMFLLISGGDDQALHMATFTLDVTHSHDFRSAQIPDAVNPSAPQTLSVLRCCSQTSVPCAHDSSVKGVWTDGVWAFSTGLDQRLRCWRIDVGAVCSELQPDSCEGEDPRHPEAVCGLVECVTCVIDVPEPASLHVKPCLGGLYQIAVVGRGLQVIKFDSCSLSCEQLER